MNNAVFSDSFDTQHIKKSSQFNGEIYAFERIGSTNDWLKKHGSCGDICLTDMQTAGKGRRGNQWISPKSGNIYFSIMWCFDDISPNWSLLGLVVGIAMAEALKEIGLKEHSIKWPNDIFWQHKKMGGILIESINHSGNIIIGIGLNVAMTKRDEESIEQDVCCLKQALEKQPNAIYDNTIFSRNFLVITMIKHLQHHLQQFPRLRFKDFKNDWEKWDMLQNQQVTFVHKSKPISGTVTDIDQHGRIGILNQTNQLEFYSSAEIQVRKLP